MPRINLLPWREQQRTERKKAFAVGMFGAFLAALVVAGIGWFLMKQTIDAQQDRNNLLRAEIKVLDKKIEEINDLEAQKQQHIARMEIIEKLQQSRPEIVHVFDTFARVVPDGVYLTSLKQTGRKFQFQGVTQSSTRVSDFMKSIDASQWLTKADVEKIEKQNFVMNAELASAPAAAK
ncbi:MAG: PilN domain-containing protein [Pseudomonadota bacterium]|jgi:type IV pilus assembly protein PilN|nr:PilN domain-containing protein [Pseudomonadota bacterium]